MRGKKVKMKQMLKSCMCSNHSHGNKYWPLTLRRAMFYNLMRSNDGPTLISLTIQASCTASLNFGNYEVLHVCRM